MNQTSKNNLQGYILPRGENLLSWLQMIYTIITILHLDSSMMLS